MTKFGTLTLSTYKSLLTGKRTRVVASVGKCGYKGYKEAVIYYHNGFYTITLNDGYEQLGQFTSSRGIKSVLNIIEGKLK